MTSASSLSHSSLWSSSARVLTSLLIRGQGRKDIGKWTRRRPRNPLKTGGCLGHALAAREHHERRPASIAHQDAAIRILR